MRNRFDLIPIKKRILAFATDGEIEAKLRSILARRWGGNNFPKLTEIVYRLYMQWARQGKAGSWFKQGGLGSKLDKIENDAIDEACRTLGISRSEAKNAINNIDKEVQRAYKTAYTDARIDSKKKGIVFSTRNKRKERSMLVPLEKPSRGIRFGKYDSDPAMEKAVATAFANMIGGQLKGKTFPKIEAVAVAADKEAISQLKNELEKNRNNPNAKKAQLWGVLVKYYGIARIETIPDSLIDRGKIRTFYEALTHHTVDIKNDEFTKYLKDACKYYNMLAERHAKETTAWYNRQINNILGKFSEYH